MEVQIKEYNYEYNFSLLFLSWSDICDVVHYVHSAHKYTLNTVKCLLITSYLISVNCFAIVFSNK